MNSSCQTDENDRKDSVDAFINVLTPLIERNCIDIQTKRLFKRYIQRKAQDFELELQVRVVVSVRTSMRELSIIYGLKYRMISSIATRRVNR